MNDLHFVVDGGLFMPLISVFLFMFGVIGMTHIIVDSKIFAPIRDWLQKRLPEKVSSVITCYQCTGFWCGLLTGWIVVSHDPLIDFVCGCAGSFLSSWAAFYLNYLEAQTMIKLSDTPAPAASTVEVER